MSITMTPALFLLACNQYGSETTQRFGSPYVILKFFDAYFETATAAQRRMAVIGKTISYSDMQALLIKENLLQISE